MPEIQIQKIMFVDGEQVHVSGRAPINDAAHLTGGEMKALKEKLGWSIDGEFHIVDAEGNLVLESKLEFF